MDTQPTSLTRPTRHPRQTEGSNQIRPPPTFSATHYPEVSEPFCRLPLLTLFYLQEPIQLEDLLRFLVRSFPGFLPRDFQGPCNEHQNKKKFLVSSTIRGISLFYIISFHSKGRTDRRFFTPPARPSTLVL